MVVLDPNLAVSWSFPSSNLIRLHLQGQLTGWAGIGFGSPHQSMDTYVGWILSSGTAVLQDGYSSSFDIPSTDATQSARMVSASQVGQYFQMTFERLINTRDRYDTQLSRTPFMMSWAYHLELNSGSSDPSSYYPQHTNRGQQQVVFNIPNTPITPSVPSVSIQPSLVPGLTPNPSDSTSIVPTFSPSLNHSLSSSYLRGDEQFFVSWKIVDNNIQFSYDCIGSGWVGIGFDHSSRIHRSTDTYMSWILSSGRGITQDGYSSSETQPITDSKQSVQVSSASLIDNHFRLTFERPLDTSDSQDIVLSDNWVLMGWAYHPTANPNTENISQVIIPVHTKRGSILVNVISGETQTKKEPIFPSTYYIIMCLILLFIYILYRWVKYFKTEFPHGIYYKGSQPETYETKPRNLCWNWLFSRNTWLNVSRIDTIFGVVLIGLNAIAIGLGIWSDFSQSEIWGYLSTANSLLVAIPATRNSVLSWLSNIPFDQTIMYHRWLGRITIIQAFVHLFCSLKYFELFQTKSIYGYVALGCLTIIGASSIEYIRRNYFNSFFYTHHIFFVYYVFGALHSNLFRIYTFIAMGIYGLDHLIRLFKGLYPRQIIEAKRLTSRIIKIRFPKYKFTKQQKVGQYVFLNFPQISLLEWHPFTLANGPDEPYYEVYIKNLGDYTQALYKRVEQFEKQIYPISNHLDKMEIIELDNVSDSESKIIEKSKTTETFETFEKIWVRVDGPYGNWSFQFQNYPHLLFICGGIGIAPCLSLIRHIYDYNNNFQTENDMHKSGKIKHIYLVWCCSTEEDAQWVNQELLHAIEYSKQERYPKFDLFVFITGSQRRLLNSTYHIGRPNLEMVFNTVEEHMLVEDSRACVFACGPKSLTLETWDTWSKRALHKRYDYHQEIFEF